MSWRLLTLSLVLLGACSGSKECVLDDPSSCPSNQICETVQGREKPLCFAPVVLKGKVYDLGSGTGIAGAAVLASDENGAAAGAAVLAGSDGTYELRIPSARSDEQGAFTARTVMLRSQARNYLPFPSGARLSLPVSTAGATRAKEDETSPWVLQTAQTDMGLSAVPSNEQNLPSVSGTVEVASGQKSVLLALESSGKGRTTLAAPDGTFTFFNVPAGAWKLSAYSRGVNYTAVDVTVASADVAAVAVKKSTVGTATLSGKVQLVAGAAQGTSVVLALESTFLEALGRGEVVPGLRAPEPGTAANLTGDWSISGIPDGRYVVLAAFENDSNVRDPDPGISGTQIQHLTVSNGAIAGGSSPEFKVTAAVTLVSPGKDGPEGVSGTPTFTWTSYSNADAYELFLFDAQGHEVWKKLILDKATVSSVYGGPALTAGQFYQWRVTAIRKLAPTSQTEELRGVFYVKQ